MIGLLSLLGALIDILVGNNLNILTDAEWLNIYVLLFVHKVLMVNLVWPQQFLMQGNQQDKQLNVRIGLYKLRDTWADVWGFIVIIHLMYEGKLQKYIW